MQSVTNAQPVVSVVVKKTAERPRPIRLSLALLSHVLRVHFQMIGKSYYDMSVSALARLLCFETEDEATAFVEAYGIRVVNGEVKKAVNCLYPS